jgi:ATP-binding cassette subfamily B protein
MLNIVLLLLTGVLDSLSVITIAPVVDLLVNTDMKNISSITRYVVKVLEHMGITVTLGGLFLIFALFNVTKGFAYVVSRYIILRTKYAVLRNIMLGTFEDFFRARWYFFSSNKEGVLLNTFLRETNVVGDAFGAMATFFANIIQCILFLSVPFFISWKVSSISIVSAIIFALPFTLLGKMNYRLGKLNTSTDNKISSVISESLGLAKVIMGFGNQSYSLRSLAKAFDDHSRVTIKSQILAVVVGQFYQPFGILVLIIAFYSGRHFQVPLSETVVILFSFMRILPLIGSLSMDKNSLNNFFPSYEQIMNLRKNAGQLRQTSGSRIFTKFQKEIAIKDLHFSYPNNQHILANINITVPKGRMVAFVGESGSGKSTLVDMVMGFNEPNAGLLMIDGVPIQEYDVNAYRKRIGYVSQDTILFNMSIRDNLLWANDKATEEDIKDACLKANATEFIESFPEGYDTIVGNRGVRLSGGQVQRIAIARAILRNPELLILDEATSSLDSASEKLIQQAIDTISRQTTTIVIAHRLSTIVNADYIYVLKNGKIVEEGTYQQLINSEGVFSNMANMQLLYPDND